jgi:hypothetical protein
MISPIGGAETILAICLANGSGPADAVERVANEFRDIVEPKRSGSLSTKFGGSAWEIRRGKIQDAVRNAVGRPPAHPSNPGEASWIVASSKTHIRASRVSMGHARRGRARRAATLRCASGRRRRLLL